MVAHKTTNVHNPQDTHFFFFLRKGGEKYSFLAAPKFFLSPKQHRRSGLQSTETHRIFAKNANALSEYTTDRTKEKKEGRDGRSPSSSQTAEMCAIPPTLHTRGNSSTIPTLVRIFKDVRRRHQQRPKPPGHRHGTLWTPLRGQAGQASPTKSSPNSPRFGSRRSS